VRSPHPGSLAAGALAPGVLAFTVLAFTVLAFGLVSFGAASAAAAGVHSLGPTRKAGYWNASVVTDRVPAPRTRRVCVGAALFRPRSSNCGVYQVKRASGAWVLDMDCRSPRGAHMILHSVTTGNLASKYATAADVRIFGAPDPARNGHHTIAVTWTYVGPCPKSAGPSALPLD
jgi:hypothetical protein